MSDLRDGSPDVSSAGEILLGAGKSVVEALQVEDKAKSCYLGKDQQRPE